MQLMSFLRSSPSSSKRSSYSRNFDMPDDSTAETSEHVGGAMLPIFLNDLQRNNDKDMVEVRLELDDNSIVLCSVTPVSPHNTNVAAAEEEHSPIGIPSNSTYASVIASRICRKFQWLRSPESDDHHHFHGNQLMTNLSAREEMKSKLQVVRNKQSARHALGGLRFISKSTSESDINELWGKVETRFDALAKDGLLAREDFGECIGMADSKEFAVGIFDALVRRRRQKTVKINKAELHEFWLQISDQSFDARLQIFFDMADSNGDGRITREEVQELIMLSASVNKLSRLKECAAEYASLIMEELDPEGLGYIELWQLETLLLQRDNYMSYSRPLSTTTLEWSQNLGISKTNIIVKKASCALKCLVLDNWQRGWILLLWLSAMTALFTWKFLQYRQMAAFQVMGYCLATAKGAAETLKFNMALILLPVCRNILTRLRSTRARILIPFDDNINFHKIIAHAIAVGIILHAANHLACDFPHLVNSSPEKFALVASDFDKLKPTYRSLLIGVEGITGLSMVTLMTIAFTLATRRFRRSTLKLPPPLNRLTGFNAFWYSHHLLALVYVLLILHGTFLFFVHKWYQKTTWMYISIPLILYIAERSLRIWRSEDYAVKILKVSVLPGDLLSLIMSKPDGFKYKSGQYIFLQCPTISSFEWHPFSITSAPGDDYLSVHIRIVGDWTKELKRVFTEDRSSACVVGRAKFEERENVDQRGLPRMLVDGPYGAPAQDYQNYDALLLVGLGIGATPFISILKDLLNNTRPHENDLNTETSASDDSWTSFVSSSTTSSVKKKSQRIRSAHFYWVTREPGSFEWFKGVMNEVSETDHKGLIEMHNYLTSVYEEGDARSTLITMIQALNHAKHGVDILSGTRVRTHFARPKWMEVFKRIALKHPYSTVGVFYCGMPVLAKELKKLSQELTYKTSTRFEFHKENF
ncbi:respiratory burst oxidase homolog protein E [Nicotiana tabacum]|uniref:Respiratory burst oxidase homolog protein E n=2 Tax=Nicotiana TaxID=4085 RepID=A0A1S4CHH5_TOBAC|nr:PREDICTED: respiratory burst oxidase homolog protein E-like [Nicotiana sylvestris]XP_016500657.1 PREDICTED: respiratory burst oxidase homolog protein E-like isoform X1 [Nicotiana tabacum]